MHIDVNRFRGAVMRVVRQTGGWQWDLGLWYMRRNRRHSRPQWAYWADRHDGGAEWHRRSARLLHNCHSWWTRRRTHNRYRNTADRRHRDRNALNGYDWAGVAAWAVHSNWHFGLSNRGRTRPRTRSRTMRGTVMHRGDVRTLWVRHTMPNMTRRIREIGGYATCRSCGEYRSRSRHCKGWRGNWTAGHDHRRCRAH